MKRITKAASLITATAIILTATAAQAAPTGNFSISGSGSYTVGDTFSVTVVEDSAGQNVNAVQANLSYNPAALQVVGLSTGAFTTCPVAPSASGSTISFQCAALGTKYNTPQVVGTISFKALTAGSTTVSTLSSSAIVDADTPNQNDWSGAMASGTYSIAAAGGQGGGSGSTGTGAAGSTGTSTGSKPAAKATGSTGAAATTSTPAADTNTTAVKSATTSKTPVKSAAKTAAVATTAKSNTKRNVLIGVGALAGLAILGAAGYFARTRLSGANKVLATSIAKTRSIIQK